MWNLSSAISIGWFAGPHNNTITYHRVNVAYLYCADVVPRCACLALTMVKWYQITLYLQCPPPQIAVSPSSVWEVECLIQAPAHVFVPQPTMELCVKVSNVPRVKVQQQTSTIHIDSFGCFPHTQKLLKLLADTPHDSCTSLIQRPNLPLHGAVLVHIALFPHLAPLLGEMLYDARYYHDLRSV